jgi:hypothetical protein
MDLIEGGGGFVDLFLVRCRFGASEGWAWGGMEERRPGGLSGAVGRWAEVGERREDGGREERGIGLSHDAEAPVDLPQFNLSTRSTDAPR